MKMAAASWRKQRHRVAQNKAGWRGMAHESWHRWRKWRNRIRKWLIHLFYPACQRKQRCSAQRQRSAASASWLIIASSWHLLHIASCIHIA